MTQTLLERFSPDELRERLGPLTIVRADLSQVEVRAAEDSETNEYIVSGHAAVFDVLSVELGMFYRFREKIERGAFRKVLDEGQDVVNLFDHEGLPLARTSAGTLELREDPRGLFDYARWAQTSYSDPIATALQRHDLKQQSFAFTVAEDEWVEKNVEGQEEPEVIRTIKKIESLYDVSVVSQPAYPQTDAGLRSQQRKRELITVASQFGLDLPEERLADVVGKTTQLSVPDGLPGRRESESSEAASESGSGAADGDDGNEGRGAVLGELRDGAKRRLALARAKTDTIIGRSQER